MHRPRCCDDDEHDLLTEVDVAEGATTDHRRTAMFDGSLWGLFAQDGSLLIGYGDWSQACDWVERGDYN